MSLEMLVRFALLVVGLLVFGAGIRNGNDVLRWTGIVLVAAALVIRLIYRIRRR